MRALWQWRYVFMGYIWRGRQMNRITGVEIELRDMASGKRPLPDKEGCRNLAIKVGTPREYWPEELKRIDSSVRGG